MPTGRRRVTIGYAEETARELHLEALKTASELATTTAKMVSDLTLGTTQVKNDLLSHEKVCSERYGFILEKMNDIEKKMTANNSDAMGRSIALSNRLWVAAGSFIGLLAAGAATLVVILIMIPRHV